MTERSSEATGEERVGGDRSAITDLPESIPGGGVTPPQQPGQAIVRLSVRQLPVRAAQFGAIFLNTVVVSRALGPAARAQYALPLALAGVITLVFGFSLEDVAGRILAQRRMAARELMRMQAALLPALSIAGSLLAGFLGIVLRRRYLAHADVATVWLSASTILLAIPANALGGTLVRIGGLSWYFRSLAIGAVAQVSFVAIVAGMGSLSPRLAVLAYVLSLVITLAILYSTIASRLGRGAFLPRFSSRLIRSFARGAVSLHAATIGNYLNLRVDLLLLGALASPRQVGLYSVAASLAALVFAGFETISQSLAHPITELSHQDAIRHTVEFIRRTSPIAAIIIALTAAAAYPLVRFVYGAQWTDSVPPLLILAGAAGGLAIGGNFHLALLRYGRPRLLAAATISAALVNVGANLLLIPIAGINGAAAASLASYWFVAIVSAVMFSRATGTPLSAFVGRWGRTSSRST